MSMWTYFHGFVVTENPIPENYFGKELKEKEYPEYSEKLDKEKFDRLWHEVNRANLKEWINFENHKDEYLPCGSEGTLRYLWQNKKITYTFIGKENTAYVTKIVGNLRDYCGSEYLCDWFRDLTKKLKPIQAYVSANSDLNGEYQWAYQSIGMDKKYCLNSEKLF